VTILEFADGVHRGVPESVYHARILGVASKSVLDLVDRSPATYAAWLKGSEREETDALRFGKAFHTALLEPGLYETAYAVVPKFGDCRKTENKKRRDDWRAENEGRKILEHEDAIAIAGMVRSIEAHPLASRMLRDGIPELTLKWTDPETGLVCKGRADYFVESLGMCVDVKTTDDARPGSFAKSVANFGYHRQHAFYEWGFSRCGSPVESFCFLAVEKRPPYLVALYSLDEAAVALGLEWSRRTLDKFAECVERGEYPGYSPEIETLSLPRWAA
jgi:hypothetical protein